ncbi:MAG: hypothetical protein PHF86_11040 [Candidatus Nanoarchaeia archaeon]|nr:hypothetical protein [Candidatus Nanoarchaeia archaeon]
MARNIDPKILGQVMKAYSKYLLVKEKNKLGTLRSSNLGKYREVLTLVKGLLEEIDLLLNNRDVLENQIFVMKDETKKKYAITVLNNLLGFKKDLLASKGLLESSA